MHKLTVIDQTVQCLRQGIESGQWRGELPGVMLLATEFNVSGQTMQAALKLLEEEGWIVSQGVGKPRRAVRKCDPEERQSVSLRVGLIVPCDAGLDSPGTERMISTIVSELKEAGHRPRLTSKSMRSFDFDPGRIFRMVTRLEMDAWVVAGAEMGLLEMMASAGISLISLGGAEHPAIPCVGLKSGEALRNCTRRLITLGHRRIVLVAPPNWRKPILTPLVKLYLSELADAGIAPSAYHLPDWDQSAGNFKFLLQSLFSLTPPTALIVGDYMELIAVMEFLRLRGLRVPEDVSVVVMQDDPALCWFGSDIARFSADLGGIPGRIVDWVGDVTSGRRDVRKVFFETSFIEGDSIGPAHGE